MQRERARAGGAPEKPVRTCMPMTVRQPSTSMSRSGCTRPSRRNGLGCITPWPKQLPPPPRTCAVVTHAAMSGLRLRVTPTPRVEHGCDREVEDGIGYLDGALRCPLPSGKTRTCQSRCRRRCVWLGGTIAQTPALRTRGSTLTCARHPCPSTWQSDSPPALPASCCPTSSPAPQFPDSQARRQGGRRIVSIKHQERV